MDNKKKELNEVVENTGKGIKSLFGKAKEGLVKIADQNDDGTFDKEDLNAIANTISDATKNTAAAIKETLDEQRKELERKKLQPIFLNDLDDANFTLTKLIRITEIDKKRAESEVCQGSIGYYTDYKDLRIINIYSENVNLFGLQLFPNNESEIYYVDPCDRDKYIPMEQYFKYLKECRVIELKMIAQCLGAKYFRVVYKEREAEYSSKNIVQNLKTKATVNSVNEDINHNMSSKSSLTIDIVAESEFEGQEPVQPELHYLKRDPVVQNLIASRFNFNSSKSEKYTIEFSNTLGIKHNDAVKIDAALKALKVNSNTSVESEVQRESRKYFEFEIRY